MSEQLLADALALSAEEFEQRFGATPALYRMLVSSLRGRGAGKRRSGRSTALSSAEEVLLALERRRYSLSLAACAERWGVHESTACRIVARVERAVASLVERPAPLQAPAIAA